MGSLLLVKPEEVPNSTTPNGINGLRNPTHPSRDHIATNTLPMYRLADKNKTVPKGFVWIDPITTQKVYARNYPNWMSLAIEVRQANGNPLPTEEEMEDQLCGQFDEKTRRRICIEVDGNGEVRKMGVGSTLKDMLARIGVHACWSCINLSNQMDDWGPDGCEERMDYIVSIMVENANKRNWAKFLPFKQTGSEGLVRMAIEKVRNQNAN